MENKTKDEIMEVLEKPVVISKKYERDMTEVTDFFFQCSRSDKLSVSREKLERMIKTLEDYSNELYGIYSDYLDAIHQLCTKVLESPTED